MANSSIAAGTITGAGTITAEDVLSGATISTATVASTDKVIIQDADDSDNVKTVTAQSIADLGGGGGGGAWNFLTSATASSSSSVAITSDIDSTYDNYVIVLENVVMVSDSTLALRVSTDSGSSYIDSGNLYEYANMRTRAGSVQSDDTSAGANQINLTAALTVETDAGNGIHGTIHMFSPANSSLHTYFMYNLVFTSSVGGVAFVSGAARYEATTAVNAIRFSGSANISSGTFRLYGVSKS